MFMDKILLGRRFPTLDKSVCKMTEQLTSLLLSKYRVWHEATCVSRFKEEYFAKITDPVFLDAVPNEAMCSDIIHYLAIRIRQERNNDLATYVTTALESFFSILRDIAYRYRLAVSHLEKHESFKKLVESLNEYIRTSYLARVRKTSNALHAGMLTCIETADTEGFWATFPTPFFESLFLLRQQAEQKYDKKYAIFFELWMRNAFNELLQRKQTWALAYEQENNVTV